MTPFAIAANDAVGDWSNSLGVPWPFGGGVTTLVRTLRDCTVLIVS